MTINNFWVSIRGNPPQTWKLFTVCILINRSWASSSNHSVYTNHTKQQNWGKEKMIGSLPLEGPLCLWIAGCDETYTLHLTPWIICRLFRTLAVIVVDAHLHSHSLLLPSHSLHFRLREAHPMFSGKRKSNFWWLICIFFFSSASSHWTLLTICWTEMKIAQAEGTAANV